MAQMSNSEILRQQAEALDEKVGSLDREDLPTANIVVAGITGTGKSTLINAVFGANIAKTGTGRPITENISDYNDPNIPIRIWDTVGFELDSEKTKRAIQNIRQTIADKTKSPDQFDRIHAIWYCIQEGANRYQSAETDFVKTLYELGVPFVIVVTKSITDDEYANTICDINSSIGIGEIEVIPVLAQDYKTKLGTISAFGLDTLVNTTLQKLPEFIKSGFVAAQRVDIVRKRVECEKIIIEYAEVASNGFWDKVPLVQLFTTDKKIMRMFSKICLMYNTVISEDALSRITKEFSTDPLRILEWMVNPITKSTNSKLKTLLDKMSQNDGLNVKNRTFDNSQRAARMITFYGYTFLVSIEEIWNESTEKQLENIKELVERIRLKVNQNLQQNSRVNNG